MNGAPKVQEYGHNKPQSGTIRGWGFSFMQDFA